MSASRYTHLDDVRIIRITDGAFLIEYDGEEHWIPKSQIADVDNYSEGDEQANISVTNWIAGKLGIEGSE